MKSETKNIVYVMIDVQHSLYFCIISQTHITQDINDFKQEGLYYFHNNISFFHALMDIFHGSYKSDQYQKLGCTSPKMEGNAWGVWGHMVSSDTFAS